MKKTLLILAMAACLLLGACSSGGNSSSPLYAPTTSPGMSRQELGESINKAEYTASSNSDSFAPSATTAPAASPSGGSGVQGGAEASSVPDDGHKRIYTGYYDMETLDYPKTIADIEALVGSVDGYIQYSTQGGGTSSTGYYNPRYATYILRVPAEAYITVGHGLEGIATVLSSERNVEEVTDAYYDAEARLATLRVQEERLLALMGQATELEAIIQLEQRLSEVRYSIESYQGTLRRLDSQISYSTITVYVREVFEATVIDAVPVTLGQRIANRFKNTVADIKWGFESFVVAVLGDGLSWLINLAILALIGFALWKVLKVIRAAWAKRQLSDAAPRRSWGFKKPEPPESPEDNPCPPTDEE